MLDEAEALFCVEPLDGAGCHASLPVQAGDPSRRPMIARYLPDSSRPRADPLGEVPQATN
ncbi:hypothetical protein HCB18_07770 [Salinispora arenicola]|nr:hypothetical protein [Salinispora arenicola]NIL60396.1 hypothetical protein [Salinispora arenicola]